MISKTKYLCVLCGLTVSGERKGAALIVALIILLLLALIGSTIMMVSVNDDRMINDRMSNIGALAAAEAGIAEAIRRLSLAPSDTLNLGDPNIPPRSGWETYILLNEEPPPPDPPIYYKKSIQMQLPESLHIAYSTIMVDAERPLKISHKCDEKSKHNVIYYNWREDIEEIHDPGTYKGKFLPVELIEATGSVGGVKRTLQVEVARHSLEPTIAAALSCNTNIEISGKLMCCGHNHIFTTPWGTNAGSDRFECFNEIAADDEVWHTRRADGKPHATPAPFEKGIADDQCRGADCIAGISAPGHEIHVGKRAIVRGNPDWSSDSTGAQFYYLYRMLNTASWKELEEKFPWQSIEPGTVDGGSFVGYYKCEGDLDLKGIISFTGVLWVTGKLKQRGHLTANGIIYTGGTLVCNGNVWILGAVAIEGDGQTLVQPFNGKGVLLYSRDGIERALAVANGYQIIARREK